MSVDLCHSRAELGDSMKIAMIGHKRVPSRQGGIEIVVGELASRMSALGHQVTIYNRHISEPKLRHWNGCRVVEIQTFANEKLNALVYSFFATLHAIASGYDILHFHAEGPSCMIFLAKIFGKKCVSTIHGLDWQRAKWGRFASAYLMLGEKQAAKRADQVIVLSDAMGHYFKDRYGRDTAFIPNGITPPKQPEPDIIVKKYGLKKYGYILFLARLTPEKGLHYLLDAYAGLDTNLPLVVAGGTEPETEYIKSIRAKADKDPRVILTGFVQGQELAELYSNCLFYVLPSDVEGMAMSLLEAVSFGAPCLVSDIPENRGVADFAAHFFAKSDISDLQKALKELIGLAPLRDQYFKPSLSIEEAKSELSSFFKSHDWDNITEQTLELYRQSIGDSRRSL